MLIFTLLGQLWASQAPEAEFSEVVPGSSSRYFQFETANSEYGDINPDAQAAEPHSFFECVTARFSGMKKKYVIPTAAILIGAAVAGITYWRLTIEHDENPEAAGICPPASQEFLPFDSVALSDTLRPLLTNLVQNSFFFGNLSALWSLSCKGFNENACTQSGFAFQNLLRNVDAIIDGEADQEMLAEDIKNHGTIACKIIPKVILECHHDLTSSAKNFSDVKTGRICPGLSLYLDDAKVAARFFFYNDTLSKHRAKAQRLLSFNRSNNIISCKTEDDQTQTHTKSTPVSQSRSKSLSQSKTLLFEWFANMTIQNPPNSIYWWEEVTANGAIGSPPPRGAHTMNIVGNDLYVFGGLGIDSDCLNDIWKFNGSWFNITPSGINPSIRASASSASVNSKFFIFGGNVQPAINLLWQFDTRLGYWNKSQELSEYEYYQSAAMSKLGNNLYIFGGGVSSYGPVTPATFEFSNVFNPAETLLSNVTPAVSPPARYLHSITTIDSEIYLFGGQNNIPGQLFNDLWKYDGSSWTLIQNNTNASSVPTARSEFAMGAIGKALFVFGANHENHPRNDLWKFDTSTSTWINVFPNNPTSTNGPLGRAYNGALCNNGSDLYLFGGWGPMNDLWRMHMTTIGFSDISIAPNRSNSVFGPDMDFDLSWQVDTQGGASTHTATINYDGSTYVSNYSNALGRITLKTPTVLRDFLITLIIKDTQYPAAHNNQTLKFVSSFVPTETPGINCPMLTIAPSIYPTGNCTFYNQYLAENTGIAGDYFNGVVCDTTTSLIVGMNSLNDATAAGMAPALQQLTQITCLYIMNNAVSATGAAALAPALQKLTQLTALTFWNNEMGAAGVWAVVPALQQLTQLTQLNFLWSTGQSGQGDSGTLALACALQYLTKLTVLKLDTNINLGINGTTELVPALKMLTQLTTLDLSQDGITDEQAMALIPALQSLKHLTTVCLASNNIGEGTQAAMRAAVKNMDNLTLYFSSCPSIGYGSCSP